RIARQRGREILLHEERRLPPSLRQLCGRIAVLAFTERLRESRKVILHRWYHQKPAGSGEVPPCAHQREVVAERAIPAPPLPRDGPPLTARLRPRPRPPGQLPHGRPVSEAVPGADAHEPDARRRWVTVDDEALVRRVFVLAHPGLDQRGALQAREPKREIRTRRLEPLRRGYPLARGG